MSFTDAVRDGFSKYATFSGRSSRPAYWWWFLFGIIAALVGYLIDAILGTGFVFYAIVALALLLPNLAVTVRRLHDTGRSGWWILIGLIPLAGGIVMLVFMLLASDGPNKWGNAPDTPAAEASALA
jgi:uncharacterized membrane protein YhaH (DUF805 family)